MSNTSLPRSTRTSCIWSRTRPGADDGGTSPQGSEVPLHLRRWIDIELDHVDEIDDGPYVSGTILCLAQDCYRCHSRTGSIVGVLVDPKWSLDTEGFVPFDVMAEELADAIDRRELPRVRHWACSSGAGAARCPPATSPTVATAATPSWAAGT